MYEKGFDNQQVARFKQLVAEAGKIVLYSHTNADGDACGSILGLARMLE